MHPRSAPQNQFTFHTFSEASSSDEGMDGMDVSSDFMSDSSSNESNEIICKDGTSLFLNNPNNPMEAEDLEGNKYIVSQSVVPYYNKVTWHGDSIKTSIELAVCGGNIYAMLFDGMQCTYQVGVSKNNHDNYYRISNKLNITAEGEDIFDFKEGQDILDLGPSIDNFFHTLIFSYFLGDIDIANIGIVRKNSVFLTSVRFDPEMCFSSHFIEDNFHKVTDPLNALFDCNLVIRNNNFVSKTMAHKFFGSFFTECFETQLMQSPKFVTRFLSNTFGRQREIYFSIGKILGIPPCCYDNIINNTVSNLHVRKELSEKLMKRLAFFKEYYDNALYPRMNSRGINKFSGIFYNKRAREDDDMDFLQKRQQL